MVCTKYATDRKYKGAKPDKEKSYHVQGGFYRGRPSMGESDLRRLDRRMGYYGKKKSPSESLLGGDFFS